MEKNYSLKPWWCFVLWFAVAGVSGTTILEKLAQDTDLSEFYSSLIASPTANLTIQHKQATVFAPTNEAFQRAGDINIDKETLILYHITNVPKTVDQLLEANHTALYSESVGNIPLWITMKSETYNDAVYVNNARLLLSQSNFRARSLQNKDQVLHKIDEVLIPAAVPRNSPQQIYNPNAWEFLANFEYLNMNNYRIRLFRERVTKTKKADIFKSDGGQTFFIPIDDGSKHIKNGYDRINEKTIDGHVIPRNVLFTAPTRKHFQFQTLATVDNVVRVFISLSEQYEGKTKTTYVQSRTILADAQHKRGVVMAEIVKANIPVKNGVVHLIHKPLLLVDSNVRQLLEEKEDGPLSKFCQEIKDAGLIGENFLRYIATAKDITLFAPSNSAWDDGNLKNILRRGKDFEELLKLHVVPNKVLFMDDILRNNQDHVYRAPTNSIRKDLYFNVAYGINNRTLTVEGGGVNATVIQPDLVAENGVVHIIDRVLGIPYTTVLDKLRTDPMLNYTFLLGERRGFNHQLNDTTRRFTYFAPRDKAWAEANITYPSTVKVLFMDEYAYHAKNILESHLVVSDVAYTMENIRQLSVMNDTKPNYGYNPGREVELPTVRGRLRIRVEERQDHTFVIHCKGHRIPVVRPNVVCTNGIIHVIDFPFLLDSDVQISGVSRHFFAPSLLLSAILFFVLL